MFDITHMLVDVYAKKEDFEFLVWKSHFFVFFCKDILDRILDNNCVLIYISQLVAFIVPKNQT